MSTIWKGTIDDWEVKVEQDAGHPYHIWLTGRTGIASTVNECPIVCLELAADCKIPNTEITEDVIRGWMSFLFGTAGKLFNRYSRKYRPKKGFFKFKP